MSSMLAAFWAFVAFSLAASAVYIVNDLADAENDRLHPTKCERPIASGRVLPHVAVYLAMALLLSSVALNVLSGGGIQGLAVIVAYVGLNVLYSLRLKQVPLVDVCILSSGYVARVFYGALACSVDVSGWLYLTVLAGSFFLGFGKRRGELDQTGGVSRAVLLGYPRGFLEKNMYVCLGLSVSFYALWALESPSRLATVPLMMVLLMRYSLDVERGGDGDPMRVVTNDVALLALGALLVVVLMATVYAPWAVAA